MLVWAKVPINDMVNAANEREFHAAFAKVVQAGAGGLLISSTVFFIGQRRQLVMLAAVAYPSPASEKRLSGHHLAIHAASRASHSCTDLATNSGPLSDRR